MSITPYLDLDADPETKRVLAVALEMTRVSLGLTDDLADGRHGERTKAAIAEQRKFGALLKLLRAGLT